MVILSNLLCYYYCYNSKIITIISHFINSYCAKTLIEYFANPLRAIHYSIYNYCHVYRTLIIISRGMYSASFTLNAVSGVKYNMITIRMYVYTYTFICMHTFYIIITL